MRICTFRQTSLYPVDRSVTARSLAAYVIVLLFLGALSSFSLASESLWIAPQKIGDPLLWGRKDGIIFGLPSDGGLRGPRGLIRVGVYSVTSAAPKLLNYIAIEPVVTGPGRRIDRLGFSEMEESVLDPGERGKRLWVDTEEKAPDLIAGDLQTIHVGPATVERLSVKIRVERFTKNGAHVHLIASIDSDHPSELRLSVFNEDDGPMLDELTLTATMGNYERLRLLWLKGRVEDSRALFSDYTGEAFVEKESFPLDEMLRVGDGDAVVYCTSNEFSPHNTDGNDTAHWKYDLPKITQYWRVPGHDLQPDLRVRVNARRFYWASIAPVLGGIAFENFEVRQRYVAGQTFIFGLSEKEPWEIDPRLSHLKVSVQGELDGDGKEPQ